MSLPPALRSLTRDPVLMLSATLILAVCIGANTTVFSLANSILIRALPYPDSEHIDWISERSGPNHEDIGAAPDYYRIREGNRVFQEVAAFTTATLNWTGIERPEQVEVAFVSPSFFSVMATRPMLGRNFSPDEDGPKAPPVIVVSYAFWRNRLGSDRQAIGKTIALDRAPHTIIGVMPQGFDFPRGAQVWTPLGLGESAQRIAANSPIFSVSILARRKPDVTSKEVENDVNRLAYLLRIEYKVFPTKFRWDLTIEASPLQQHLTGPVRSTILALSGAACLVMLIACVNLANLLLARAGVRQREVAVRLALGAGRGRIVQQVLVESLALSAPGGMAGIGFAWLAIRFLNIAQPAILVSFPPITMDWFALAFTVGLTLTASLLFGMAPGC